MLLIGLRVIDVAFDRVPIIHLLFIENQSDQTYPLWGILLIEHWDNFATRVTWKQFCILFTINSV